MRDRHGMALARSTDACKAALPGDVPTRLTYAVACIRDRMDSVSGASRTEPATWTSAQFEDVVATLDGVADMAAREADRLRGYRDSMS